MRSLRATVIEVLGTRIGVSEDEPVKDPAMLKLATLRSHDQYNTTIYTLDDRYRRVFGSVAVVGEPVTV